VGSNPFVKSGKPAIDMGKPIKVAKAAKVEKGSRGAHHHAPEVRPSSNLLPTVESTDRALSAALLRLAIAPTPEAHLAVAERYRVLGILDMAYEHYLRASQIDRTDASAYEGLARTWRDWGFPQLGMADASRAVYYAPASASAHNTWGTMLAAVGRREARRGTSDHPADPGAATPGTTLPLALAGDASQAVAECNGPTSPTPAAARDTLASIGRRRA
jgi:hypothetical protein